MTTAILFGTMLAICVSVCNGGNPDAKRLYDDLLSNYNKLVRPVVNVSEAVTVRLKLKLSQLIDVVSSYYAATTISFVGRCVFCHHAPRQKGKNDGK